MPAITTKLQLRIIIIVHWVDLAEFKSSMWVPKK